MSKTLPDPGQKNRTVQNSKKNLKCINFNNTLPFWELLTHSFKINKNFLVVSYIMTSDFVNYMLFYCSVYNQPNYW